MQIVQHTYHTRILFLKNTYVFLRILFYNNNNNNNIHICIAPYGRNFRGAEGTVIIRVSSNSGPLDEQKLDCYINKTANINVKKLSSLKRLVRTTVAMSHN